MRWASTNSEGDMAEAGQASVSPTATWLAGRPATAVLDRDRPRQDERGRGDHGGRMLSIVAGGFRIRCYWW
jgi:hypothetical protein